ncbi:N-glycosylase/DNA lyase [Coniochaeta sp. 2T2.1]|nr:N-glycosylase/DNA lyase [Coniochaeta sp. 2T2.1]
MAGPRIPEWRKLPMSLTELCIDTTLRCGQAFRWRKLGDEWHCTLQGRILSVKQDSTHLHYRATWPSTSPPLPLPTPPPSHIPSPSLSPSEEEDDTLPLLTSYFNLPISLSSLYRTWSSADPNFARRSSSFAGIRILNQPAWEALVAFICSSNNHISRISSMVHKLCVEYGPYLGEVVAGDGERWHDFPTPDALAGEGVEHRLRELGFGYRAGYLVKTARMVRDNGGEAWLRGLRNPASVAVELAGGLPEEEKVKAENDNDGEGAITYKAAHEALLTLSGVGPKVADCVCLMGLGWHEAVPVDTHVWQIAQRDYKFGRGKSKTKTFNKAVHDAVGDHFRGIWGEYAGWAQSVLFTANLRSFAEQAAAGGGGGGGEAEEGEGVKKEEEKAEEGMVTAVKVEKIKVEAKVKIEEAEGVRKFEKIEDEVKIEVVEGVQKLESIEHDIKDVKKEETDDREAYYVEVTGPRRSKRRKVQA